MGLTGTKLEQRRGEEERRSDGVSAGGAMALPSWQDHFDLVKPEPLGKATLQWAAEGKLEDVLHCLRCSAQGAMGTASGGEVAARKLCVLLMQMMPHLARVDTSIRSGLATMLQVSGDWVQRGEVMDLITEKGGLEA